MSQDSSKVKSVSRWDWRNYWLAFALPIWVYVCFNTAKFIADLSVFGLVKVGVPLQTVNEAVLNTIFAAGIYILTLAITIGLPWYFKKYRTSLKEIGLDRLPNWKDILMTPAGFVLYLILTAVLAFLATKFLPGFNANQVQQTGFQVTRQQLELILAFITLVVIAPIAEEVLFRGFLLAKLKRYIPLWLAILVVSGLFGFLHGAWNVGLDTFALSIVLCILRETTDSLWASILLHMVKNGIAFYVLFISPALLSTLVK